VSPSTSVEASVLVVDVTGWVRKPGVFEFQPGERVIDAVERAGGARDGADLTLLNLAAPLADGQQILVPKKGEQPSGTGTVPPGSTGGTTGALVNINTADEATLETLNGVGPVLAASIIAYRTEHGPFTAVDQLDEVSGIGPATLEDLRSQVTV
jgi:competence protein ComEA